MRPITIFLGDRRREPRRWPSTRRRWRHQLREELGVHRPHLRVFLTLQDGTDVSIDTADDAVATRTAFTPIPVH